MSEETVSFQDIPQFAFLKELGADLGVAPAFFHGLLNDDDWSFIIKLHSVIDAAVTHLLIETLEKPDLRSVISRLSLGNMASGKLAFIKSMNLLDSSSIKFTQTLSDIRNKLVHNVSNVSINLEQYASNLSEKDRKEFDRGFKWGYDNADQVQVKTEEGLFDLHELTKFTAIVLMKNSIYKLAIWLGSIIVLRQIHAKVSHKQFERQRREIDDQLISLLIKLGQGAQSESEIHE